MAPFPESPYELVLYLLEKRKLDLTSKNLTEILRDFWFEIEKGKIATELIGDFLVAFSKLLILKIDYLLGVLEEEPEILVDLRKYRTLQKAKRRLKKIAKNGPVYFSRKFIQPVFLPPKEINLESLRTALDFIFVEKESFVEEKILEKRVSLEEALSLLEQILLKEKELVLQEKFFEKDLLIALFLAMLIWFKEGKLEVEQTEVFGKIKIKPKAEHGTE